MMAAIKALNNQLRKDTGINTVRANQVGDLPTLPYGVYNVTSPYIKDTGHGNTIYLNVPEGMQEKLTEQFKSMLSFNLYGVNTETTIDLANQVRRWFLFFGEEYLSDNNIVVVSVGNVEDRTTFLVDSYEYKYGFDVQLRMTEEQLKAIDYFDQVVITKGD